MTLMIFLSTSISLFFIYVSKPNIPARNFKTFQLPKLLQASGYDDITPLILKAAAQVLALPLSVMINHCISAGVFSNQIKVAKVVPVYKSDTSEKIENYRSISLLPYISKMFERIIYNRMESFSSRNDIIIPSQFGFRCKHSTILPTLDLITESLQNTHKKRNTINMGRK